MAEIELNLCGNCWCISHPNGWWAYNIVDGVPEDTDGDPSFGGMTEPQQILLHAAERAMLDVSRSLRERGWPIDLIVDYLPERRSYAVSLRFELPHILIPNEYANRPEGRR